MTGTEPRPPVLSTGDAAIVLEALEHVARPQLAAQAERLLERLRSEPGAAQCPGEEQDPDERRRLRTRLLYVLGSVAGPGQPDYETADVLAAMPGDVCKVVTRWLELASGQERRGGRRHTRASDHT
jgi:hypothetical protein